MATIQSTSSTDAEGRRQNNGGGNAQTESQVSVGSRWANAVKASSKKESTMYHYNPRVVSRVERQAFQLSGDKLDQQLKNPKREQLTASDLNLHWKRMLASAGGTQ